MRNAVTSAADLGLVRTTVETDSIVGSVLERRPGEINLLEHSLASFNDLSSPSSVQSRTEDTTGKQHPGMGGGGRGGKEENGV